MTDPNFEIAQPWVRNGDGEPCSFATLATLAAESVDVILTDPPYNKIVHENMYSGTAVKKYVDGGGGPGGIPKVELPFEPLEAYEWAADLPRVARRWAISFCAVEDFGEYRRAVGSDQWVRGGIWYKPNSMGQLRGDRPAAAYEGLAIMHRTTRKEWNGRGSFGVWSAEQDDDNFFICNGTRGEHERHPNQKPLKLCLELVAKFTKRGETVLDLFAGSGRIGEACLALGRKYVGLERDPVWVDRARHRLSNLEVPFGAISDAACLRLCACPKPSDLAAQSRPKSRARSA